MMHTFVRIYIYSCVVHIIHKVLKDSCNITRCEHAASTDMPLCHIHNNAAYISPAHVYSVCVGLLLFEVPFKH